MLPTENQNKIMVRSVDSILSGLKKEVENPGSVLDPELWIEAGFLLCLFIGAEQSKLFGLQQEVAARENEEYEKSGKMTVAKNLIRATDLYKEYKLQEARVKNIEEFIRISKARAKMASGNY